MPRPKQDGPKRVVRRLKDGSTWVYLYDRQTGETLGKEPLSTAAAAKDGTMAALILTYRASAEFTSRKPRTRETYAGALDYLAANFGDIPVRSFTPASIKILREGLQATPSKFNNCHALLSILFNLAINQGDIQFNPASTVPKLEVRPRIEVWSRADEARFVAAFRPRLQLLFMLLLYTLQRMSDVLSMTINQVTEQNGRMYIVLRQAKTNELVGVPVHENLRMMLRARLDEKIDSLLLVPSPRGMLWSRRNASRAWDVDQAMADKTLAEELKSRGWSDARIAAELKQRHRQRRDLRRTGVVRMAEGGATTGQIAAVSGHQIDWCQRIIDTYLPRRTEVALGGIEAWEASEKAGPRVIRLSDEAALESEGQSRRDRKSGGQRFGK